MKNNSICLLLLCWLPISVAADVFIYMVADGQKMISDHPVTQADYQLITEKKTLKNVGYLLANRTTTATGKARFQQTINEASNRYGIDPSLVEAVIRTESGFNPLAMSKKGATGLMQLSDATANFYHVFDSLSPEENINAGVKHLSRLLTRYKGDLALVLAAYNAGETAVAKYAGVPPYPETRRYIRKVLTFHSQYWQLRHSNAVYPYQKLL